MAGFWDSACQALDEGLLAAQLTALPWLALTTKSTITFRLANPPTLPILDPPSNAACSARPHKPVTGSMSYAGALTAAAALEPNPAAWGCPPRAPSCHQVNGGEDAALGLHFAIQSATHGAPGAREPAAGQPIGRPQFGSRREAGGSAEVGRAAGIAGGAAERPGMAAAGPG
jgi:hypothetical protein